MKKQMSTTWSTPLPRKYRAHKFKLLVFILFFNVAHGATIEWLEERNQAAADGNMTGFAKQQCSMCH